jgi:hypothetical protein
LNGNLLRATTDATPYANVLATYQTEFADFASIAAIGTGGAIDHFVVRSKDGAIYEYGAGPGSKASYADPNSNPTVVLTSKWKLSKATDRDGNNYIIEYSAGTVGSSGVAVPDKIKFVPTYQGSTSYKHEIQFVYVADTLAGTEADNSGGILTIDNTLLTDIVIKSDGITKRRYHLSYLAAPTTAVNRISEVTECSDDALTTCLQHTVPSYADAQVVSTAAVTIASGQSSVISSGDFNGDSRTDIVYVSADANSNPTYYAVFGGASGFGSPQQIGFLSGSTHQPIIGDVLGRGASDILRPANGTWYRYYWNGATFVSSPISGLAPAPANAKLITLADVNADGLPDFVVTTEDSTGTHDFLTVTTQLNGRANGTGGIFASAIVSATWAAPCLYIGDYENYYYSCGNSIVAFNYQSVGGWKDIDYNGDGRADLYFSGNYPYMFAYVSNGTSFVSDPNTVLKNGAEQAFLADLNDDKCTDISYVGGSLGLATQYSTCGGPANPSAYVLGGPTPGITLDWDGDTRPDVVGAINENGLALHMASGAQVYLPLNPTAAARIFFIADLDGDGRDDLGVSDDSGIRYFAHAGAISGPPNYLTSVTDGYGVATSISYRMLRQGNYSPGVAQVLPERLLVTPMAVVDVVTARDGAFRQSLSRIAALMRHSSKPTIKRHSRSQAWHTNKTSCNMMAQRLFRAQLRRSLRSLLAVLLPPSVYSLTPGIQPLRFMKSVAPRMGN